MAEDVELKPGDVVRLKSDPSVHMTLASIDKMAYSEEVMALCFWLDAKKQKVSDRFPPAVLEKVPTSGAAPGVVSPKYH